MAASSVFPQVPPGLAKCSQNPKRIGNPAIDCDIRARVHELLMLLSHPVGAIDRRTDKRYAYPYLVRMTPMAPQETELNRPSIVVVGKTLSEGGFGFYHQQPIADRRMIASFHAGDDRWRGFLIDLRWCRFAGHGWYESGGRFLQAIHAVPPPDTPAFPPHDEIARAY